MTAAITANMWMSNEKCSRCALPEEALEFIKPDCMVSHRTLINDLPPFGFVKKVISLSTPMSSGDLG